MGYVFCKSKVNDIEMRIVPDEDTNFDYEDDFDFGKMYTWSRKYSIGNKNDYREPEDFLNDILNLNSNSRLTLQEKVERAYSELIMLPIFMLDHTGITISTGSFNDPWDSGQIGWIFCTKEEARKEYNVKRLTKKYIDKAKDLLENEVELYDKYLRGDVYCADIVRHVIVKDKYGNKYNEEIAISSVGNIVADGLNETKSVLKDIDFDGINATIKNELLSNLDYA